MESKDGGQPIKNDPKFGATTVEKSDGIEHQTETNDQKPETDKVLAKRIDHNSNRMTILTAVIAVTGLLTAIIFYFQYQVMHGQLDEMKTEGRAWVKLIDIKSGDLDWFGNNLGGMDLDIKVGNVGHSPAFNVVVLPYPFIPTQKNQDLPDEMKQRCAEAKDAYPKTNGLVDNAGVEKVLFPDEQTDFTEQGLGLGGEDAIIPTGQKSFPFWFYICIDYTSGVSSDHHQTWYVYRLSHIVNFMNVRSQSFDFKPNQTLSARDILLNPRPLTGVGAN